jgi:hypothetical protein
MTRTFEQRGRVRSTTRPWAPASWPTRLGAVLTAATAVAVAVAIAVVVVVAGCEAASPRELPSGEETSREPLVGTTSALRVAARGLVRDVHASPLAAAVIEVRVPGGGPTVACELSASDGTFALAVRTGSYDILVTARAGFEPQLFAAQVVNGAGTLELVLVRPSMPTLEVRGRIVDRHGGAFAQQSVCVAGACTTTDGDGQFALTADADEPQWIRLYGTTASGARVSVTRSFDPSEAPALDVVRPDFDLAGQVVDAAGAPVTGVGVISPNCYPVSFDGFAGMSCLDGQQVDATGRFHFVTLPGPVQLLVVGPLGTFVTVPVAGDTDVTIPLSAAQALIGRIVDRDGNGVDGQRICLLHDGCVSKYCNPACVYTGGDGRYQLEASGGDYQLSLASFSGVFGSYDLSRAITLAQPTELNVTLPNRQLTGHVRDSLGAPAAGATVTAECYPISLDGLAGDACPGVQTTDTDGRFQLMLAAPGVVTLRVQGSTTTALPVAVSGDDTDVEARLPAAGPASGRVVDANGKGLPGQRVCYSGAAAQMSCATTDGAGQYELTLGPGEYSVFVTFASGGTNFFVDSTVTLPSLPATIRTLPIRQLSGQVLDGEGRPLVGANIALSCLSLTVDAIDEFACGDSQVTDDAGRFQVSLLAGSRPSLQIQPPSEDPSSPWFTVDDVGDGGAVSVTVAIQPPPASPSSPGDGGPPPPPAPKVTHRGR